MSLTNLTTKTSYAGNGVTTVFPFTFKIFDPTHLVVTETTAAGVTSTLVLNTDYTVTGVGLDAGGTITRLGATSPPPTGTTGLIRRVLALTQTADIRNQSAFYASVHEDVFDKLTMVDQQQEEEIGRSLQIPEQYSVGISNQLPAPVASTAIGWNAAGTGLANLLIPGTTIVYVASFNGRIGTVQPALNDYSFGLISGVAAVGQIPALPASQITSGTLAAALLPAFTGDVTTSVGSTTTTLATTQPGAHTWNALQTFALGSEDARFVGDNAFVSFYNTANTTRSGYLQITTTGATLSTDLATPINFSVNGGIKASLSATGAFSLNANIASTTTTNGTLVVTGGAGISGQVNIGDKTTASYFTATNWAGVFTTPGSFIVSPTGGTNIIGKTGSIYDFGIVNAAGTTWVMFNPTGTLDMGFGGNVTAPKFIGPVTALKSATTSIDVSAATAPSNGQVLTATSGTTATWQTPGAMINQFNRIANGSFYMGLGPWVTSGATAPVFNTNTATSGTSGSASMAATAGVAHVTNTGSISQAFSIPAPSGALTLTYKTACYYSAASFNSNTGSVKVYIYNASTGTETLVATNSLTATASTPSFTNQSVTVTSNITGPGEWGVRFELMADVNNVGGSGTQTTTTLLDDVVLVV